ncbi:MAG: class I SAM-dependent methyltransferase [Acidobacteria bacterium]|nr:class I SAM-dependent methyltransferase [Acidobacteriota bacterium]
MKLTEFDTGIGTSYERLSIYSLTEKLAGELGIRSSLEGPIDGITGINGVNSIALARMGVHVTVVLPSLDLIQYAKRYYEVESCQSKASFICSNDLVFRNQFDLVWNFNCLPQREDHDAVLEQMTRCSRKYIMVFTSNTRNYGFWIHRLHHVVEKEEWYHGNVRFMNTGKISATLRKMGFRTIRHLYVDVPWWPDIDSPIEEVAGSFFPFLKSFLRKSRRLEIYKYNYDNFPYFQDERRKELLGIFAPHPNFESSRLPLLKLLFAHHRGILAEKMD